MALILHQDYVKEGEGEPIAIKTVYGSILVGSSNNLIAYLGTVTLMRSSGAWTHLAPLPGPLRRKILPKTVLILPTPSPPKKHFSNKKLFMQV